MAVTKCLYSSEKPVSRQNFTPVIDSHGNYCCVISSSSSSLRGGHRLMCFSLFVGWHGNPAPLLGCLWWPCRLWSCHHGLQTAAPPHPGPPMWHRAPAREPKSSAPYLLDQEWQPLPGGLKEGGDPGRGSRLTLWPLSSLSYGEDYQSGGFGDGNHWKCLQTDGNCRTYMNLALSSP